MVHQLQGVHQEEGGGVPQQVAPIELDIKCDTKIKAQHVTGSNGSISRVLKPNYKKNLEDKNIEVRGQYFLGNINHFHDTQIRNISPHDIY